MSYLKIIFSGISAGQRELLTAYLSETPVNGMEETESGLFVFYEAGHFPRQEVEEAADRLGLSFEEEILPEVNWNAAWEENFRPVTVDHFCSIRAPFHPEPSGVLHDIVITPKMSFGTGHHATTELMIRMMREMDFRNKNVLDFGAGTGILAILAEKLGAAKVLAIDNDSWAYENARENILENKTAHVAVVRGSLELAGAQKFDILLANINRHILLQYMNDFPRLLTESGELLLSGILEKEDSGLISAAAEAAGMAFREQRSKDNWTAILFRKRQ